MQRFVSARSFAALALVMVAGALVAPSASAASLKPVRAAIVSPSTTGTHFTGASRLVLDVDSLREDHDVTVEGPECEADDWYGYFDQTRVSSITGIGRVQHTIALDPMVCPGLYTVTVEAVSSKTQDDMEPWTGTFRLTARPVLTSLIASSTEVWPRVKDGFKDATRLSWKVRGTSRTRLDVLNAKGRVVATSGWSATGRSWRWDGRSKSGKKVDLGTYRARLTAEDGRGWRRSKAVRIKVRTGLRTTSHSAFRDAADYRDSNATGWCLGISLDWLSVNCPSNARVTYDYDFKVPADARSVKVKVVGGDLTSGGVSKHVRRLSSTRQRASVVVRGGQYSFDGVKLTWKTTRKY